MEKIKQFIKSFFESEKGKDVLTVIIVILVGLGSFELGKLSKENDSGGLKILSAQTEEYQSQDENQKVNQSANAFSTTSSVSKAAFDTSVNGKNFFASNRGSKYYTLGCSAGKTIKQKNRIYFATGEEAQAAGYTLSSSCN